MGPEEPRLRVQGSPFQVVLGTILLTSDLVMDWMRGQVEDRQC